jgi:hypothetical protein
MPVTMSDGAPDDVAGADFELWLTLALGPAHAARDDQSLAERMRMPRRACSRLEGYDGTARATRVVGLKRSVDTNIARKRGSRALY